MGIRYETLGQFPNHRRIVIADTEAELLASTPGCEIAEGYAEDTGINADYVQGPGWKVGGATKNPDGSTSFAGSLKVAEGVSTARGARLRAHLSRRVRINSVGYSIDNFYSSSIFDVEVIVVTIPGGATPSQPTFNGEKCAIGTRTKKVHLVSNCGVSGDTTTQILARSAAAASTGRKAIQDGASMRSDLATIAGPLVNDGQAWSESTDLATVDAAVARAKLIIEQVALSAPHVAFCGCMGINPSGWTAARTAYVQSLMVYAVEQLKAWATGNSRLHFLDPEGRLSVGQSWIASRTLDGIHPNTEGGGVWADMIEELIDDLFDVTITDPVLYDYARDWNTVVSGKPTGTSVAVTDGATNITTATENGVLEISFTAPTAAAGFSFQTSSIESVLQSAGIVAGDKFFWEFDIELLKSDRTPHNRFQIDNFVRFYNAANEAGCVFPTSSKNLATRSRVGFCTPVMTLDRPAADLGSSCDSRLTIKPLEAGSFIARIFAPQLRRYTTGLVA